MDKTIKTKKILLESLKQNQRKNTFFLLNKYKCDNKLTPNRDPAPYQKLSKTKPKKKAKLQKSLINILPT